MIRFHASLLLLLASACNGEVGVGTLSNDASSPGGSCPGGASVETLYSHESNQWIADFVSNGSLVVAAVHNPSNDEPVIVLPTTSPESRSLPAANPVDFVAGTHDRFFFSNGDQMTSETWRASDDEQTQLPSEARFVTSHPDRKDIVFFVQFVPGSGVPSIWSLTFGGEAALAMGLGRDIRVDSLAVSATGLVVLIDNTPVDGESYKIVRPPTVQGGGVYELVADIDHPVSNVALDGDASFVATIADGGKKVVISRYEGKNLTANEGTTIGSFEIDDVSQSPHAHIVVDDDWLYVSGTARPALCKEPNCPQDLAVYRFKKDGSDASQSPVPVKTFVGPGGLRPFAIDSCYFTWYDVGEGKLYRQPKASL